MTATFPLEGDCLDILRSLDSDSVDAIVTDPPYELGFMGKGWDASGIAYSVPMWSECLRVLKPGGYLLSFGGTRTYHRMACAVQDAGFEIRDSIDCVSGRMSWYYGSGFPKSRAVSRDPQFCQCVPRVPGSDAEAASQPAEEVLLSDVHGEGPQNPAGAAHLHGVREDVHPVDAVSGRAEQDVLSPVRAAEPVGIDGGTALGEGSARNGAVRTVRGAGDALAKQGEAERPGVLLGQLSSQGELGASAGERVRRDGDEAGTPVRGGQPSLEGRGDLQALEGELHRAQVREVPEGVGDDGSLGRVHRGASPRDGAVGGSSTDPRGVREPHRPQPAKQRSVEPGAVSDERGSQARGVWPVCAGCGKSRVPAGLGTALKPAHEPIIVARKPLSGTVAATVLAHGTGALNIDGCRVGDGAGVVTFDRHAGDRSREEYRTGTVANQQPSGQGRWPSNVVFTHAPDCVEGGACVAGCPVADLDQQSGEAGRSGAQVSHNRGRTGKVYGDVGESVAAGYGDTGGASRFFPVFRYQAKAPSRERPEVDGVKHPTVKPLALMQWLVRLVTPPDVNGRPGIVLDPFAGSGTTLEAARAEGFDSIGIERDPAYYQLILRRLGYLNEPAEVAS